jgi:hypothetical protein
MSNLKRSNKRGRWLMSAVVVLVAGLLLAACQPAAQPADQSTQPQGYGGNGQRPNFQEQPASELPTDQPAVRGALVSVNGTTLTVQEGGFGGNFAGGNFGGGNFNGGNFNANNGTPRAPQNGTPRPRPTPGPDVQVDASGATVYEDTTFANLNGQRPSGTIQQTVVASSLDKIPANARVTIWGTLNGTQATATVIVYSQVRGGGQPQQQPQG